MNRAYPCLLSVLLACGHPGDPPGAGDAEMGDMPGMPGMKASPSTSTGPGIHPNEAAAALMGLTLTTVRSGPGQVPHRAPATVRLDPAGSVQLTTQSGGQIRSITVPAPGGTVRRGQVVARLFDPGVRAILEDVRVARTLEEPWRAAAANRARAAGIDDADIRAVAGGAAVPETFALRSSTTGVVASRPVSAGSWLPPGGVVATVTDPDAVLVDLVVDGAPPAVGSTVTLRDPGTSGVSVSASVTGVLPEGNAAGSVVRVQPLGPVMPGRPLVAEWAEVVSTTLWIPASALIDTGTRRVVFVRTPDGFVPRTVETGVHAGDEIEVRSGVIAGEPIAASGAFLLDSETQMGSMSHAGHAPATHE